MLENTSANVGSVLLQLALAGCLLVGCASGGASSGDLAPIWPVSETRLETAPPAARDALEQGLRWIAEDAPRTQVGRVPLALSHGEETKQ